MTTLIEQLITKMGLRDELKVLAKTRELVRLLELRSSNVPLQINEYGKIVLCADLACTCLDVGFDKDEALKLSGLRKSQYLKNKRMFEKLLDLTKLAGVNDICVQLSLNEVCPKAKDLLELYKRIVASENTDIDVDHPQYAAMAVFHACRLLKRKAPKAKLMPFSNLKPTQWLLLEQRWERIITKHHKENAGPVASTFEDKLKQNQDDNHIRDTKTCKPQKTETEDYEKWKSRILSMAQAKLEAETTDAVVLVK